MEKNGNLSLTADPKEMRAKNHPGYFPVNINKAGELELLRVPGLGAVTVRRILSLRKAGKRLNSIYDLGRAGKRLGKAEKYITC